MDVSNDITARHLTADEVPLLRPLLTELHKHHNAVSPEFSGVFPLVSPDRELPHIAEQITKGEARVEAFFAGTDLVAFSVASQEYGLGSIDLVYVAPEYRRRGLARRAVELSIEFLKDNSVRLIDIHVVHGNVAAKRLYESMGFRLRSEVLAMKVCWVFQIVDPGWEW
ncbi:MAG: GNAT family N-acetyltransferase [Planctomycetes bacterium]|nr:GNAT family N-acetyltransferase [Planctomycetota bacterium]